MVSPCHRVPPPTSRDGNWDRSDLLSAAWVKRGVIVKTMVVAKPITISNPFEEIIRLSFMLYKLSEISMAAQTTQFPGLQSHP